MAGRGVADEKPRESMFFGGMPPMGIRGGGGGSRSLLGGFLGVEARQVPGGAVSWGDSPMPWTSPAPWSLGGASRYLR